MDMTGIDDWLTRKLPEIEDVAYLTLNPQDNGRFVQKARIDIEGEDTESIKAMVAQELDDIASSFEAEDKVLTRLKIAVYKPKGVYGGERTFKVGVEINSDSRDYDSSVGSVGEETVKVIRELRLTVKDMVNAQLTIVDKALSLTVGQMEITRKAMEDSYEANRELSKTQAALIVAEQTETNEMMEMAKATLPVVLAKVMGGEKNGA